LLDSWSLKSTLETGNNNAKEQRVMSKKAREEGLKL
jgi:hypothetical protein